MIRKGKLAGPFTNIVLTSKTKSQLDFDNNIDERANLRKQGIFNCKLFSNLPLSQDVPNYIALQSIYIENGMYNFNHNYDSATLVSDSSTGAKFDATVHDDKQAFNVEEYISLLIDRRNGHNPLVFDPIENRVIIDLKANEELTLSNRASRVLGFPETVYKGRIIAMATRQPDLYIDLDPLIVSSQIVEESFVGDQLVPILAVIPLPREIKGAVSSFTVPESQTAWKKLTNPIGQYINVSILDSCASKISFSVNTEITLHLVIRSSPYEIV